MVTLKGDEQLFYFRQFHPENKSKSRKAYGNVIFFDKKSINDMREVLKKLDGDEKKIELREKKLVIDEWSIDSVQSKFRRDLADVMAKKMNDIFYNTVSENCMGCIEEQANQLGH